MTRNDHDRLEDARHHLLEAMTALGSSSIREVWAARERRQSLIFDLIVVGEALAKVSPETKALNFEIPWRFINATRNRLIHAYWFQDRDFVEEVVVDDLPLLLPRLDQLIAALRGEP